MAYRCWTLQEERTLRRNYGIIPTADIAKMIDRSPNSLRIRAMELGLRSKLKKGSRDKDIKQIKYWIWEGWTQRDIAKQLGITPQAVAERVQSPSYDDMDRAQLAKNWRIKQKKLRAKG